MRVSDLNRGQSLIAAVRVIAPAALFLVALWVLGRELAAISAAHLWAGLAAISLQAWALALAATACGYLILTFYDVIGLRLVGAKIPYRSAALGAFLSFAVSHNVGFGWLSSGSMRDRVYGPLGVGLADVARLTVLNSLTFFIGGFTLLGAVLLLEPQLLSAMVHMPADLVRLVGALCWAAAAGYLLLCAALPGTIGLGKARLPVPSLPMGIAQMLLSIADIIMAAAVLYLLLAPASGIGFPALLAVYIVALGASVASQVPGGLGVLEGLILLALPQVPRPALVAALIAYRLVYYLAPLAVALALLAARQLRCRIRRRPGAPRLVLRFVPIAAAGLTFTAGVALLLPGAGPLGSGGPAALQSWLPLPLLELSHLAGSVVGLLLVVLSTALYRRYDTARATAIALLVAGAAATLLGAGGPVQALALGALAALLRESRGAFYRRGSIGRNALSWPGLALGGLAIAGSIAAGLRAFADIAYSHELWWQFAYDADAPRFLRASLLVSVVALALLAVRLLGPVRQRSCAERPEPLIGEVVAASDESGANLAFVGDKRFLVSRSGRGFLMYQLCGRSWICMGDPVGPRAERNELVWRFREIADAAGGRAVFYEALADNLDLYADAGLVAHKIGEEARVDLASFTLDCPKAKQLRAALRRGERDDLSFGIIPAGRVHLFIDELRQVSDAWLAAKHAREKGFSLGYFDADYLERFDCAVVLSGGAIIAFANIWPGSGGSELSLDLMRHRSDAPRETMLFLILKLILTGQERGYRWFNLGMAPLTGLAEHRLAPTWHWVGRLIVRHGEALYGFAGLRKFKEQFSPVWRPRYIVCRPGSIALAAALIDCARLISRPVRKSPPRRGRPVTDLVNAVGAHGAPASNAPARATGLPGDGS